MAVRWQEHPEIPGAVAQLLDSLRLSNWRGESAYRYPAPVVEATRGANPEALFPDAEWRSALYFFDRHQLTLALRKCPRLPAVVASRLDGDHARNHERIKKIQQVFYSVANTITPEFLVLKGFANWEQFAHDPAGRVQYDIDLYCPSGAEKARAELQALGYVSTSTGETSPADHLPPLIRKTGWQWRGDFFDVEIPISIELHFRLWDERTEALRVRGLECFWGRRVVRKWNDQPYFALDPADAVGYTSLHLLRHLFRGSLRLSDAYELAYFLDRSAADDAFWSRWADLHGQDLRRMEAICFRLAAAWFDCRIHAAARAEVDLLPAKVRRWFDECGAAPVTAFFRPNKEELWLHLCLLDSAWGKFMVARRKLVPSRLPGPLDAVYIPSERMTWRLRLKKRRQYAQYVAHRLLFHLRALAPTFSRMLRTRP